MRVSDAMGFNKVNNALSKNREQLYDLQTQSSSLKRLNKPSDDPVAMTKVLTSKSEVQGTNQYLKNLEAARGFLTASDSALDELTQTLVRAKELAIGQANDASANEESRKAVATEVAQLYDHSIQIGNRKHNDRFIFSGYATTTRPFTADGDYSGDKGEMMIEIAKGTFLPMNTPGSMIFFGEDLARQDVTRLSKDVPLDIKQLDENVGKGYEKYTPPEKLNNESVPIRGPASVEVAESAAEENTPAPQFGENVFQAIAKLEVGLRANDKATIQDSLDRLDRAIDQVVLGRAKVGARYAQLDSTMQTLYGVNYTERANISNLQDADIMEVFTDLSKNEAALQATLASSAKVLQPSLLDFLR